MPTPPTLYGRPGVYITEQLIGPTPAPSTTSPSVCAFAGEHWSGPSGVAIQCNSWRDFTNYFGGFNSGVTPVLSNKWLPYAVYMYFFNGGQTAWVTRIVGTGTPGASSSVRLLDTSATPQNTLSLTAGFAGVIGNIGAWGNNLFCDVTSTVAGRFGLNIYNGGHTAGNLVETWPDLSMVSTDARYAPAILNSPISGSLWVVATDLGDTAPPPTNTPAVVTGVQFSGGIDCSSPSLTDRINTVTAGTSPFDRVPAMLNFAMPGEISPTVTQAAITYALQRPSTFFVLDPPVGQTPAGAVSYFSGLAPVESQAAMYYPWVVTTDPSSSNLRSTVTMPPSGLILGQMVAMDNAAGVWHAPAGLSTVLSGVVKTERMFSPADLGSLNLANVNALRTLPNGNVVIWGARTMQTGYASLYVPIRRTLNFIEASLSQLLEYSVFAPNDAILWSSIIATCDRFLGGILAGGGFPGTTARTSYYIICDDTNNTPQTIAQGIVNTTVGLALLYPAEFIALTIAQFQSTGSTTVTTVTT